MATTVDFDAAARVEFDNAFDWYAQRSPGAAIGFASEVDAAIDLIAAAPDRFPETNAGCRSCGLHRYSYRVIYYRSQDTLIMVAKAHAKRRPAFWRDRYSLKFLPEFVLGNLQHLLEPREAPHDGEISHCFQCRARD